MRDHVSDDLEAQYLAEVPLKELAQRAAEEGLSLLDCLALVRSILMQQTQLASTMNDRHGLSAVSGRLLECLKQIGTLTGELRALAPGTTINNTAVFVNSPVFADLQGMLVRVLSKHPHILSEVLDGLSDLERRHSVGTSELEAPMSLSTGMLIEAKPNGGAGGHSFA
jgi:hypothetical protein